MASQDEPAKIACPCCNAVLTVDRNTMRILFVAEHRPKAGGVSFEQSLQELKEREKQKGARFQQAVEEEKQRKALLGKKFQELQKQADTLERPIRPIDLE